MKRRLPVLYLSRARDSWRWPEGARPLETRKGKLWTSARSARAPVEFSAMLVFCFAIVRRFVVLKQPIKLVNLTYCSRVARLFKLAY